MKREPRKARKIEFTPRSSAREAAHAAVAEGRAQFEHNVAALPGAHPPELLHQTRVALRRLRVFVRLFRSEIGRPRAARLDAQLRWLFALLGSVRDLQVFQAQLARRAAAPSKTAVQGRLERRLRSARRALDAALASSRARALHDELAALERDLERPADDAQRARRFLSRRLDKRRRRTLQHFEAVLRKDLPELHRLRKQLKKLRYTAELARSLYPARAERARKFLRSLGELQDVLGALVDAQVARSLLESLRAPQPLRVRLTARLAQREAASLAELEAGFQHFADTKPFWS